MTNEMLELKSLLSICNAGFLNLIIPNSNLQLERELAIKCRFRICELKSIEKEIESMPESRKWIVFWLNGGRIGSVELNELNWIEIKETFIYNEIQTDITGTVHLDIFGIRKTNKANKANGSK